MKRFYALFGKSSVIGEDTSNLIFWSDREMHVDGLEDLIDVPGMTTRRLEVLLWKKLVELNDYLRSLSPGLALSIADQSTPVVDGKVPYLVWGAKDAGVVQVLNLPQLSISENAKLATSMIEIRYPNPGDRIIEGFEDELTMYAIVLASEPENATQLGQEILQQITDSGEWRETSCF